MALLLLITNPGLEKVRIVLGHCLINTWSKLWRYLNDYKTCSIDLSPF